MGKRVKVGGGRLIKKKKTYSRKLGHSKPRSITAHVAHADFLTDYAWHARGSGFANTVTKEGWRLFSERLAKAQQLLDESVDFEPKCPMWWLARMTLARGQSWSWDDYERLFQEAK